MKNRMFIILILILFASINVNAQVKDGIESKKTSGPGSYKILKKDNTPIKIPFKMHNRKPIIELEIDGKKATLMIDNGILWDQVWLFGTPLVEELDLKPNETGSLDEAGSANSTSLYSSRDLKLAFKDIIFYDQPVLISPPAAGYARMFPGVDGQLCNTFFKHFIVEFDFIQNEIILHNPESFRYKGQGSVLDMKLTETGTHSVPFQMKMKNGKAYSDQADIDFGGIYSFKVALNTKLQIEPPSDVKKRPFFSGTEYIAQIENMTIGKYTFEQPTVVFGDEKTSRVHPKNLGVIGLPMFMKFNIIFNYFDNKLYIEPNKNFDN